MVNGVCWPMKQREHLIVLGAGLLVLSGMGPEITILPSSKEQKT
jgi:hypothetical protein